MKSRIPSIQVLDLERTAGKSVSYRRMSGQSIIENVAKLRYFRTTGSIENCRQLNFITVLKILSEMEFQVHEHKQNGSNNFACSPCTL